MSNLQDTSAAPASNMWLPLEDEGVQLLVRRVVGQPVTVIWAGCAGTEQLERFIFDVRDENPIKAIVWKHETMIEVEQLNSPSELAEELAREQETFDDATFVRFETEGPEKKQVVVWSTQEHVEEETLRHDGVNGVGVYMEGLQLGSMKDRLATFIFDTYRSASWTTLAQAARKKIVGDLMERLVEQLA
jgi:hypothetical protein